MSYQAWTARWKLLILIAACSDAIAHLRDQYHIHSLEKEHRALQGRDSACTKAGYSLCAASAGGDCCPEGYDCAPSYCFATTAGPTTACSRAGYYNCPGSPGACCPTGYICREEGCIPTAGVTPSSTCPPNSYMCPSSLNYGCCRNGLGCALDSCYSTMPTTYIITSGVTTTDSAGSRITSVLTRTSVETPSAKVSKTDAGAVPKLVQSTVSKEPAIETSTGSGVTLTQAQLGGVIAGVLIVLIAIIVASFVIIRRLRRRAAQVMEESKRDTSAANQSTTTTHKHGNVTTSVTEVDVVDIDPLTQMPSELRPLHTRARSDPSVDGSGRYQSPARSPGLSSGQSTPPAWPGRYNPVSGSDDGTRYPSFDSGPEVYHGQERQGSNRGSYDSQASRTQNRHWSNVSELSGSGDGAHGVSELDDLGHRRRSSSGASRPSLGHVRRSSDPSRGRSESSALVMAQLGTVNEINELHGYYGPADRQTGQTGARPVSGNSRADPRQ